MITAFYALPLAALYLFLSIWVVTGRVKTRVSLGDGGDDGLQTRIRTHANFAEYTPFALVLMLIAEQGGAGAPWLHAAGATLVLARFAHAWGLGLGGPQVARGIGYLLSLIAIAIAALAVGLTLRG